MIDEKVLSTSKSASDKDMFLGMLFPADEHRLYVLPAIACWPNSLCHQPPWR